jgi:oxaloacetate decarboxylase gamma subunit
MKRFPNAGGGAKSGFARFHQNRQGAAAANVCFLAVPKTVPYFIEEIVFMTIAEMLGQSGMMAVIGMGIVFAFLIILVFIVSLTGKIIHALGLDKDVQAGPVGRGPSPAAVNQTAVVAAIGAAVTQYQKDHS